MNHENTTIIPKAFTVPLSFAFSTLSDVTTSFIVLFLFFSFWIFSSNAPISTSNCSCFSISLVDLSTSSSHLKNLQLVSYHNHTKIKSDLFYFGWKNEIENFSRNWSTYRPISTTIEFVFRSSTSFGNPQLRKKTMVACQASSKKFTPRFGIRIWKHRRTSWINYFWGINTIGCRNLKINGDFLKGKGSSMNIGVSIP